MANRPNLTALHQRMVEWFDQHVAVAIGAAAYAWREKLLSCTPRDGGNPRIMCIDLTHAQEARGVSTIRLDDANNVLIAEIDRLNVAACADWDVATIHQQIDRYDCLVLQGGSAQAALPFQLELLRQLLPVWCWINADQKVEGAAAGWLDSSDQGVAVLQPYLSLPEMRATLSDWGCLTRLSNFLAQISVVYGLEVEQKKNLKLDRLVIAFDKHKTAKEAALGLQKKAIEAEANAYIDSVHQKLSQLSESESEKEFGGAIGLRPEILIAKFSAEKMEFCEQHGSLQKKYALLRSGWITHWKDCEYLIQVNMEFNENIRAALVKACYRSAQKEVDYFNAQIAQLKTQLTEARDDYPLLAQQMSHFDPPFADFAELKAAYNVVEESQVGYEDKLVRPGLFSRLRTSRMQASTLFSFVTMLLGLMMVVQLFMDDAPGGAASAKDMRKIVMSFASAGAALITVVLVLFGLYNEKEEHAEKVDLMVERFRTQMLAQLGQLLSTLERRRSDFWKAQKATLGKALDSFLTREENVIKAAIAAEWKKQSMVISGAERKFGSSSSAAQSLKAFADLTELNKAMVDARNAAKVIPPSGAEG